MHASPFHPQKTPQATEGRCPFEAVASAPARTVSFWLHVSRARRGFLDLTLSADVGETRYTSQSPEVRRGTRVSPSDARSSRIQSGQTCGFARLFGARAVAGVEAETSTNLHSGRFMRKCADLQR